MAWTSPRTWVAGEIPTATMLNDNVRENTNALHDGLGSWLVVINDGAEKSTAFNNTDLEKERGFLPLEDVNTLGAKWQLRIVGYRHAATMGAGTNTVKVQVGTRNAGDTADPTFTTAITLASAAETTKTFKDSGWTDLPGGLTLTHDGLVVRYTATADNTGQTTWTTMTVLARIRDA